MNLLDQDVFEAVRRGYSDLEIASNEDIVDYFASIDPLSASGHQNNIKGILFEQEYVELLAIQGVEAAMFEATNHPITDIMVFDSLDGVSEFQLKATDSVSYVTAAMEADPEVTFVVTSEVAVELGTGIVIDAGIENAALELAIEDTLFGEFVNPVSAFSILRFLIGIPF
ncbi:hypothetical protein [Yoonia maritima]|uniref:hypothetical protein n=1 Tax=Yoonia maritima TaxID=1435347 RepID=UPI0019550FCA|nr:hypothetical protein [Yoonia maritima]